MDSELTKVDIPGASLEGRAPEALKIAELKFWLRCCGAMGLSKLKTKSDYVQRLVVEIAYSYRTASLATACCRVKCKLWSCPCTMSCIECSCRCT